MTGAFELDPTRGEVAVLFADYVHLPAIRGAALEGRLGRTWGDDAAAPTAARIDLGCYAMFGGDPGAPGAETLIEGALPPIELVYPTPAWRTRILEVMGGRVHDRPMETYAGDSLDPSSLSATVERLAPGYRLAELDLAQTARLDARLEPHGLQTFGTPEALLAGGMAWGVFFHGAAGAELVGAATSYTASSRWVEVAISTRADHRGRGLAEAAAARFCLAALERGQEPCWSASNPVSQRLALRLGFRPLGECEILLHGASG